TSVKTDIDRELKQEELRKALERDAGLDEIKQIMNTDQFSLEDDDTKPDYQVKAIPDEPQAEEHDPKATAAESLKSNDETKV
ncbi:MAG: hypothetical protein OEZ33_11940, partial [Gammaproteobacteria bacterium]|nr:hypothetical protein [Gammaproteobacteria bacterium]